MALTRKQEEGLKIAVQRYRNGEKYTTIAGYAGTGKTYVAEHIISALGLKPEEIMVGAFTGKAAFRLQESGFPQALTLHKILYKTLKTPRGFIHTKLPKSDFAGIKLFLFDEVSMIPDNMLRDAAAFGIHTIMLGDPGQLPPIGKDNGMLQKPHIFLDEIMRQAAESSIIRLSKDIREGNKIQPFCDEQVQMFPKEELTSGMLLWADQVLCGKNATRNKLNQFVRREKGYTEALPQEGEKIIITANNWELMNKEGYSLVNGMLAEVTRSFDVNKADEAMGRSMGKNIRWAPINFQPDVGGSEFTGVKYDAQPFIDGTNSYIVNQFAKGYNKINYLDFGYVITVHKFQGSECNKGLGIEERMNGKQHKAWLYTMSTRFAEKFVLLYDSQSPMWDLRK